MLIAVLLLLCGCQRIEEPFEASYTELGVPQAERYAEDARARCPWDMIVWQDRLYVGNGDYDTNKGPVDIRYYDLDTEQWVTEGTVPDEAVNRFVVLNDTLVAPGTDPRDDWTFGNYYVLQEGEWVTVRTIPGAKHVFDMVEHNGRLFAGLGVAAGAYPVACSEDGGESFYEVAMYRDGVPVDTSDGTYVRVYDLFSFGNELYAALFLYANEQITFELYRYDGDAFVFDNSWYGKVGQVHYIANIVGGKACYRDKMFFTTGYLYATTDMETMTKIVLPGVDVVSDLCVMGDVLYAVCCTAQEDGQYRVSLWKNTSGEPTEFSECFYFVYDVPCMSLEMDGDFCYLGMGGITNESEHNGMILRVRYPAR